MSRRGRSAQSSRKKRLQNAAWHYCPKQGGKYKRKKKNEECFEGGKLGLESRAINHGQGHMRKHSSTGKAKKKDIGGAAREGMETRPLGHQGEARKRGEAIRSMGESHEN